MMDNDYLNNVNKSCLFNVETKLILIYSIEGELSGFCISPKQFLNLYEDEDDDTTVIHMIEEEDGEEGGEADV
jgi:hypothetical protein